MKDEELRQAMKAIDAIKERLERVEEIAAWSILAKQRFEKGNRVQFSAMADRKGMSERRKGRVRTGRVVAVGDGYTIDVLLDGYARPHAFHHSFFDHASGKRARKAVARG